MLCNVIINKYMINEIKLMILFIFFDILWSEYLYWFYFVGMEIEVYEIRELILGSRVSIWIKDILIFKKNVYIS